MKNQRPTLFGAFVAVVVGVILLIFISEISLRFVFPRWREFYSGWFMTLTEVPGHVAVVTGTPNFDGYFSQNNGDFRSHIKINATGFRNDEPAEAADGRLWIIGDSMMFGWGVERTESLTGVIARETGMETYNVAAPGADVCGYQALAAHMPKNTIPRAVIVGLVIENDLDEYDCAAKAKEVPRAETTDYSWRSWKYYLTGYSALYNFFAVSVKRVAIVERLLESLGIIAPLTNVHVTPTAEERQRLVKSTAAELQHLREMFPNIPFAVLIVPGRFEIQSGDINFAQLRHGMESALADLKIDVIDPFDALKAAGFADVHFAHDGHWNARGHQIAAQIALPWVRALSPSPNHSDQKTVP